MKRQLIVWKRVFGNWKYLLLIMGVAILFYSLQAFITNFSNLASFYSAVGLFGSISLFLTMLIGFVNVIPLTSVVSLILISFLFGILFSLVLYKYKSANIENKSNAGFFASIGAFLGILAPGCAACGIGLLPLLGLSSAFLLNLPLRGLELSLLAIVILITAIFKISEDSCKIMLNKKNERRLRWKEKI